MKVLKILAILLAVYVGIVVVFETLLGIVQPANESTMVIVTEDDSGASHPRVVTLIENDGARYVAVNHWPRAWYRYALARPDVSATIGGETADYTAVPVEGGEYLEVDSARPLGVVFRILTGFPPREFPRLDPV